VKQRTLNIMIALDIFLFAVLCLGNVKRRETASAAAWSLELAGKWQGRVFRPAIDTLFWLQPEHCLKSYEDEVRYG
jgi:hypothetical protein